MILSLILPSLNVAKYIDECIQSVIKQKVDDFEIICVDAGSEDGTLEKLEMYAKNDSRIRVIISDKKSYGYQVNIGIRESKGDYIAIVETDDFVEFDMYETLLKYSIDFNLDCVKCDHYYVKGMLGSYDRKRIDALRGERDPALYYRVMTFDDLDNKFAPYLYTWAGIYKRELIVDNNIFHNETPGASYQDNGFWFQTMMYAKRFMVINEALYNLRRDNEASSYFANDKYRFLKSEYDFLHNKIERSLFDSYKKHKLFELCFFFRIKSYEAYYSKIDSLMADDFFEMVRGDIERAIEDNEVSLGLFKRGEYSFLLNAIQEEICLEDLHSESVSYEKIRRINESERMYIYGAGKVGLHTLKRLEDIGYKDKVKGFLVTKCDQELSAAGMPIFEIGKYCKHDGDLIVVAVGKKYRKEVLLTLETMGYNNFLIL